MSTSNHRTRQRRGNRRTSDDKGSAPAAVDKRAWLAPPIGAAIIVALAAALSLAQATDWVFLLASLVFSLCEGVVLALVGFTWIRRGVVAAVLAAAVTAAVAAPLRWEVRFFMHYGQPIPQTLDLLTDLAVSVAWGAFAGLAGATILRPKLAALMKDDQERFTPRPPR